MGRITRTPQAEESRLAVWQYIAKDNVDAADRLIRQIDEKCELYVDSPLLGDICDEFGLGVRCFYVGRYVIYYRPSKDGILVLLVLHSARDLLNVYRRAFGAEDD